MGTSSIIILLHSLLKNPASSQVKNLKVRGGNGLDLMIIIITPITQKQNFG